MASTIPNPNGTGQIYDHAHPAGEKTCVVGFRIFKRQEDLLEANYKGNISAILRFLLDKFLSNPDLQQEFFSKNKKPT